MNGKKRINWGGAFLGLVAATMLVMPIALHGQDTEKTDGKSAKTTVKDTTAKKRRKKARGRLPAHYNKVVTDKQRTEIYGIQGKYAEQIATLRRQLKELAEKRDAEVAAVLTDEQRSEVERARADATAARKKRADEKKKK